MYKYGLLLPALATITFINYGLERSRQETIDDLKYQARGFVCFNKDKFLKDYRSLGDVSKQENEEIYAEVSKYRLFPSWVRKYETRCTAILMYTSIGLSFGILESNSFNDMQKLVYISAILINMAVLPLIYSFNFEKLAYIGSVTHQKYEPSRDHHPDLWYQLLEGYVYLHKFIFPSSRR